MSDFVTKTLSARRGEDASALEASLRHLAEIILRANERMNLTADRDPELFWQRHIEDGLAAAWIVEDAAGAPGSVLDVGSGAGLPGLVWALLWPKASISLLDSRVKRADFLKLAAEELNLSAQVYAGRAETLAREKRLRESFDLVTARALAPLPALLELTLPFVRIGGHVAAIKSAAGAADELASGRKALDALGGDPAPRRIPYTRSDGKECEVILVRKLRPTPSAYPRREGQPQHNPL